MEKRKKETDLRFLNIISCHANAKGDHALEGHPFLVEEETDISPRALHAVVVFVSTAEDEEARPEQIIGKKNCCLI